MEVEMDGTHGTHGTEGAILWPSYAGISPNLPFFRLKNMVTSITI
jgi:hypothetical protein